MESEHNGWANFETWSANLVLDVIAQNLTDEMSVDDAKATLREQAANEIERAIERMESCGPLAYEFSKFVWYAFNKIDFEEIVKLASEN